MISFLDMEHETQPLFTHQTLTKPYYISDTVPCIRDSEIRHDLTLLRMPGVGEERYSEGRGADTDKQIENWNRMLKV